MTGTDPGVRGPDMGHTPKVIRCLKIGGVRRAGGTRLRGPETGYGAHSRIQRDKMSVNEMTGDLEEGTIRGVN